MLSCQLSVEPIGRMWALLLRKHFGASFKSAILISYQEHRNRAQSSGVASDPQISPIPTAQDCFIYPPGRSGSESSTLVLMDFSADQHRVSNPHHWAPWSHTTGRRRILRIPFLKEQVASLHRGCRAQRHWHMCLALPMNSCTEATKPEHTRLALKHRPKCLLGWSLHYTENK